MIKSTPEALISVVIPTLNRKNSLHRLIESIVKYYDKSLLEIIIVEQGQNNKKDYYSLFKRSAIAYKYIYTSTKSTSKAKNLGVKYSSRDFILFLDDDVVITRGLINAHLKNYKNISIAAVCGRSITSGQQIESNRSDTGRISYLGSFSDGYSSSIRQEIDTVIGCNASWRREIFNEIGGFDEQYTGNAMREESDLSLRAKKIGYKIIFDPRALVYHMREPVGGSRKTEGRLQWYFDYFSNEVYFFLKHRPAIFLPIYMARKIEWAIRCMFGFGREVSFWSIVTPIRGIINGIHKYKMYKYEHRS